MYNLAAHGMEVDLEIRKKLIELLNLRKKLKEEKRQEINPIKEKEIDDNILAIDELIGKVRYIALDRLGVMTPKVDE